MTQHDDLEASAALPSVALLGTGIMGNGMARNILRAGLPLRVWNRTLGKAAPLEAEGAVVAGTPAGAVKGADVIVTMLSDGPTVLDAMTAAAGGLAPGQVWAQTSTVGLEALETLAAFARGQELAFIDSPVQGTRKPAESGQLLVYAAGPGETPDPARARAYAQLVFDAIGRRTFWLPEVGGASRLKLVANSWVIAMTNAAGEAIALAQRLGIDPRLFLDTMAGSALDSAYLQAKGTAILDGDFAPNFTASLAGKDARLVVAAAREAGVRMDLAEAAAERYRRAVAQGHGDEDMAAAYFASFDGG
jgi:3-hydroxyisobutyrate dehydrogenase